MRAAQVVGILVAVAVAAVIVGVGCGQSASPQGQAPEIALPPPATTGTVSVEEALAKRRSVRAFSSKALTLEQVSQLAWAAQGITEPGRGLRTAPSAGATYPLELYLATPDGLFRYLPRGHKVAKLSGEDRRAALAEAALGQASVRNAALDIVITALYERTAGKYGARAQRYVHLEAGHVAQNIHLQAVSLGLGSVPVGAFEDAAVSKVLALGSGETPLYIIPVGHPAR